MIRGKRRNLFNLVRHGYYYKNYSIYLPSFAFVQSHKMEKKHVRLQLVHIKICR